MEKDNNIWNSEQPFNVPDGYFEDFNSKLLQRINIEEKAETTPPVRKLTLFAPWIGLAAAFLIITLVYKQLPERIFPETFMQTDAINDILFYEITLADYFKEHELLEFISESENLNINIFPDSTLLKGLNEDDLIMLTLYY